MKSVLVVIVALLVVVAAVLIIGVLLPRKHRAARAIMLHRPAGEIYAAVRAFESAPSWRKNLLRVEMLAPVEDRIRFREVAKDGSITYEVMEDVPDEKLITRIVDRDLGYFGSWTYEFSSGPDGSLVRITEDGEVPNILFRFMSRFVFGHTSTMDAYLTALGGKLGENVVLEKGALP